MKKKIMYGCLSAICFIACVVIAVLMKRNPFVRGFVGDIIVMGMVYFLIKMLWELESKVTAMVVLVLAFGIEISQSFNLVTFLGLGENAVARVVLGTVFDYKDLLAYAMGVVCAYVIDERWFNIR